MSSEKTLPITPAELAISAHGLSKAYRIWREPAARLKAPIWEGLSYIIPSVLQPRALNARLSHEGKSRYYTDFYALTKLDLEVRKGEALGIIGRNGSGKSTLLQMLAGTLTPTEGSIRVNGRVAALLELGSGFNPDFTGRENVYLNASILGLTEEETENRLEDILAFADIGDFIDQPVKTYSSGMTMRLAFAVIAHVDADILIVDEALAVGDVFFVQKCMRFIRKFKEKGTLLIVTHDTATVQSLCDRAVWLHEGMCRAVGNTKEISEVYLEAQFSENQTVEKSKRINRDNLKNRQNEDFADQRKSALIHSNLRNDLVAFEFNQHSKAFGKNDAQIESVCLLDRKTLKELKYGVGGEKVVLRITAKAKSDITRPIIGFYLKNSCGQELFGDNTYLSYANKEQSVEKGEMIGAEFHFQMPYLKPGDYSISVGLATGTQESHIIQHWLHDGLLFKSISSHLVGGLVGIPMGKISLDIFAPLTNK